MDTGLPLRRKPKKREAEIKTADILSFSSALVAVVSSAIFYLAGWFYLVHWYAFYAIDASQINIPPQTVIIHGLPSIIILILAGFLSASFVSIWKIVRQAERLQTSDFPKVVIIAYVFALLIMGGIVWLYTDETQGAIPIPDEAIFALGISVALAYLIYLIYRISRVLIGAESLSIFTVPFLPSLPRAYAVSNLMTDNIKQRKFGDALQLQVYLFAGSSGLLKFIQPFVKPNEETEKKIQLAEDEFVHSIEAQKNQLTKAFTEIWQFWVGAILILYLLLSIATSAVFGEWDAARGSRFMIGNWHIPDVSVFSTTTIPALGNFESKTSTGFEYQTLGLLSSDDKVYYLVDLKTSKYYTVKPNVYIVPRSDGLTLNFIVSPYALQVPALLPSLTETPTPTATITFTPTP